MRVLRVLAGMVLLMVAVPALLAGAVSWYAMQHLDDAGRFHARFETVTRPGYAVVVPDVDAILHRDAPFTRTDRTSVRLTATAGTQPLFLGLAAPADVAGLLGHSAFARATGVSLRRVPLGLPTVAFGTPAGRPAAKPESRPIWLASGVGSLTFEPADWRGKPVMLVVMARDAVRVDEVTLAAAVRLGWLDATMWGLLILGTVLLLFGFIVLAWPPRPVVYVVAAPPAPAPVVTWMDLPTVELAPVPATTWPPASHDRQMPILPDRPRVPLQPNGVGRPMTASGPAGGGGPTLTGGTV